MRSVVFATVLLLAGSAVAAPSFAAGTGAPVSIQTQQANADAANLPAAQAVLQKSSPVIRQMQTDPGLKALISQAKGILVMPEFGHVTFIVGGRWSSGVLVAQNKGQWTEPAFFAIGGGSLGDQAGTSSGPVALLIMSQRLMDKFTGNGGWSLNSASGFNVVNYSPAARNSVATADAVVWTGFKAPPAGIRISVNNIWFDAGYNHAMYGSMYLPTILAGKAPLNSQLASDVRDALPAPDGAAPAATANATTVASSAAPQTKATATTPAEKTATTTQSGPAKPG
jgi:SH3 domain-containing YSC84-like protein 1